jgi:phosphatidylglycerophosphatase A
MLKLLHTLHPLAEHFMQLLMSHLALSFREIAKLLLLLLRLLHLLKVLGLLVLLVLLLRMLMLKGTLMTGQISLRRLLPLLGIRSMHEGTRYILMWLLDRDRVYR